jgi:putrescine transport system ATP-binding protein
MQAPERRADKKDKNEPWRDPNAEAYVRIENVTKRFGDFVAVNNVSLRIFKGEIFCLLGGSGCGKSTLLRMMAGFENLTSGSIFLDGQDMAGVPPYERPVNMMFQSYALFPHMTVEKNIAFGLEQEKGLSRTDIATRVTDILEIVKLGQFAARRPHQLSGGQRQRVALARSLVKRPKLLLLDEPLGALDKKLREATQFELINIQEQLGVTFIVVTHDQEEAMTLASRIGVMNRGEIVQIGTPTEIYEFPQNKFVADFIGSVNMFEGTMIEDLPDRVRRSRHQLGARRHRLCRHPARKDQHPAHSAGRRLRELRQGNGQGNRLHGRHVHLPGEDRHWQNRARHAAERRTHVGRRAHSLGRDGLAHLAWIQPGRGDAMKRPES